MRLAFTAPPGVLTAAVDALAEITVAEETTPAGARRLEYRVKLSGDVED
jgi:hypothetical protein